MDTIIVSYEYAPALVAQIFVANGTRRNFKSFELKPLQLSLTARTAALTARVASSSYYDSGSVISQGELDEINVGKLRVAVACKTVRITPETAIVEPTEEQALADAESALVAAYKYAPIVLAQRDAILARMKAESDARRDQAIVDYVSKPLSVWLEKVDGQFLVDTRRSRPAPLPSSLSDLRQLDPRLNARAAEAGAEAARLNSEQAVRAVANREFERQLLVSHGTPNQIERYDADKLPTEEFDILAKWVLFKVLEGFARFVPLGKHDCPHGDYCGGSEVKFRSEDYEGPLTGEQWDAVKHISAARPLGSLVEVREHSVYCNCKAGTTDRLGCRVTIEWAGDKYAQEYAL